METITIKPYAFLTLSETENNKQYVILRYNLTEKDWTLLDKVIYTDKETLNAELDRLNQEAGLITIPL